jgi:2,5-furandicarboxylate decarboxylase 1
VLFSGHFYVVLRSRDGALKSSQPPSLRSFLAELPESEILRISEPMELDYVPTALVLELERRRQTPVVIIEQPRDYDIPVVANLFASRDRIARMAGAAAGGFNDAWTRALANMIPPMVTDRGAVQEIVIEANTLDAGKLPISRHFAKDAGRYIGSGILICKDPDTGVRNMSYQRLQLKARNRFGASLHSRGHIWEHLQRCAARGRDLEVAVVIGVYPAINLAAGAKVASEVDELDLAGALIGAPVELVKCRTIDVEVPAQAEFVLEGKILGQVNEDEGPYGEYTGYSTDRSTRNVFVVSAITSRKDPIYHDIIPGYSAEHLLLGRAAKEAHVFTRLKEMVPTLKALNFPKSGTHFHGYMSMKKLAEGQPRHALMLLLGLDPYLKLVIAVDEDVDVFDEEEVLWALATRFQADTDMFMVANAFCNRLDPSSRDGMSAKLALDATAPLQWDVERAALPPDAVRRAAELLGARN